MTTNNSAFLTDYTGNRRFACVDVHKIDIEKIRADILQLWAEGAEIYKADGGEKLHRGIEQYQETENEKHILCDSWEDEILSWIEMQDAAGESGYPITSRNILKYGLGSGQSWKSWDTNSQTAAAIRGKSSNGAGIRTSRGSLYSLHFRA